MLRRIRKSKLAKVLAVFLSLCMLTDFLYPLSAFALGGGPSQPEVQSFEPIGTTEMVDLFSGDFTYNIPLLDVGGYPINISYHSGIASDQEASWVGLGWNINPGVINRGMRGIPDDFNGDKIEKEFYIKPNRTYGIEAGPAAEYLGVQLPNTIFQSFGINYNNYRGIGMNFNFSLGKSFEGNKGSLTAGLGFSAGTSGVGLNPNVSFDSRVKNSLFKTVDLSLKAGLGFNNRAGLVSTSLSAGVETTTKEIKVTKYDGGMVTTSMETKFNGKSNGGASISFATPTYTPQIQFPMVNTSATFKATLGYEIFGGHPAAEVTGYYSSQSLAKTSETVKAYGYLYLDEPLRTDNPLLDFNREKDGNFNEYTPSLPLTNLTYDTYSVSGQGIGGMYRPFRGSFGLVSDRSNSSSSADIELPMLEVGAGVAFRVGGNCATNSSNSTSGAWTSGSNAILNAYSFKTPDGASDDYENVYFKQAGEKTYDEDVNLYNSIGANNPVRVKIDANGYAYNKLELNNGSMIDIGNNNFRTTRAKRNEVISYLTTEEAMSFGISKTINVFIPNNFNYYCGSEDNDIWHFQHSEEPRNEGVRKDHHISEISVTRNDGTRYVYGIPAYNKSQKDVTFAIDGHHVFGTGQIDETINGKTTFSSGNDDKIKNNNGIDEFYSKDITPGYAHSYLLTDILSSDYIDVDDNGPSPKDMGTYVKLNYSRVNSYDWRIPYASDEANYNEGLRGDILDDRASYIEGEKELYYLHSIETKTQIAVFHTSLRSDAKDSDGNASMYKLDSIVLYSLNDYINCASNQTTPVSIKTIHFDYDYSLCPGTENSTAPGQMKLTLKSIYFTYGRSKKGSMNKYEFSYGEFRKTDGSDYLSNQIINPSYDIKGYDRWGNYQKNSATWPNATFPYTTQKTQNYNGEETRYDADIYATSWNLTTIELPSGGKIKVDYESDDYAFVQDKKAMQMFTIKGVKESDEASLDTTNLYSGTGLSSSSYKNIIAVNIPPDYIGDFSLYDLLRDEKGNVMEYLYFKFLIDIGNHGENYEYVPGYAKIDYGSSSISPSGDVAYIALSEVPSKDNISFNMSPIVQAALNFTLIYAPRVAYNLPDPSTDAVTGVVQALVSSVTGIIQFIGGTNREMLAEGQSKKYSAYQSYVRLYNPIGNKKGGGCRVKRIRISDEWENFESSETSAYYGQEYDYTIRHGGRNISSGVASYEPGIGNDENPFRQPVFYQEEFLLAPNMDYYKEEPFGESFFPAPSVGYRKVTVTDYIPEHNSISNSGSVVHEFYTAYDFPTLTDKTELESLRDRSNPLLNIVFPFIHDNMTASQGYVVELNDMHGKAKSTMNYNSAGVLVNGIKSVYKTENHQISNKATIINNDNTVENEVTIGLDYEYVVDMRENASHSNGVGVQANLDAFLAAIFPIAIPVILPIANSEDVRFRSVVTTKVVNRYALLDRTETYQDGAIVCTNNLAYDSETGEVLLTKTRNEFLDEYYTFNYPAHWVYDGMGQAYKNIGFVAGVTIANGSSSEYSDMFIHGDEVMIGSNKYWVYYNGSSYSFIDRNGNAIEDGDYNVKVLRSGRKNIQNVSVGSIVCRNNPIENSPMVFNGNLDVISTQALELTDDTEMYCGCMDETPFISPINPFVKGIENNWRKYREYVYLAQREYNETLFDDNYNTNIRDNGVYENFSPFWNYDSQGWESDFDDPWILVNEVSKYSQQGMEVENMNALNIFSSAQFGFGQSRMVSKANNARYNEIGFDGFEDYEINSHYYDECIDDHFSFRHALETFELIYGKAHTGKKCIKLIPNSEVNMIRHIEECP